MAGVACDLPCWTSATLQHLIARRDPSQIGHGLSAAATTACPNRCARSTNPPPPRPSQDFAGHGRNCPRKFLINSDTLLLDQPDPKALDNVNTPEELAAALRDGGSSAGTPQELRVQYFALLREQAGRRDETLSTTRAPRRASCSANSPPGTASRCTPEHLKVAVNCGIRRLVASAARAGDTVVFIPPVAGG